MTDHRGGVSLIGALSLTGVIGMAAFSVEASAGYTAKVRNQRVADTAAMAAAMAYAKTGNEAVVAPTVNAVRVANGLPVNSVMAVTPLSTPVAGTKRIIVTTTTSVPLRLARVITSLASYSVSSTGMADVTTTTTSTAPTPVSPTACIIALSTNSGVNGVTMTGGSRLTAAPSTPTASNGCDVLSVRPISISGSGNASNPQMLARFIQSASNIVLDNDYEIRANRVDAGGSISKPSWAANALVTMPTANNYFTSQSVTITDPLASNTALSNALARIGTAANYTAPTAPAAPAAPSALSNPTTTASSNNWTFNNCAATAGTGINNGWRSGTTWTIPTGTYAIGTLTLTGSACTVRFAGSTNAASPTRVSIHTGVSVAGSTSLSFLSTSVPSDIKINGGIAIVGDGNGGFHAAFGDNAVQVGGNATFGGYVSFGNGSVSINGAVSSGTSFAMGTGNHSFASLNLGTTPTSFGAGSFTVVGAFQSGGTVTIGDGAYALGSYSGQGTLTFGNGNLSVASAMVFSSGTLTAGTGTKAFNSFSNVGSATLNFGPGTMTVTGAASFANGTNNVGAGLHHFGGLVTFPTSGTCTFGDGDFTAAAGITTGGTNVLTIGAGDVAIGTIASTAGNSTTSGVGPLSLDLGGGGTVIWQGESLADTFKTTAGINSGGSSKITFPSAAYHYIGGHMTLGGEVNFAPQTSTGSATTESAGGYFIRGKIDKNSSLGMRGTDVSLFLTGNLSWSGASTGNLTSPVVAGAETSGALVNILFASRTTDATTWTGSANGTYTGALYFPSSAMTANGAGAVSGCFALIASTVTLSGSGNITNRCTNLAGETGPAGTGATTTTSTVKLVR